MNLIPLLRFIILPPQVKYENFTIIQFSFPFSCYSCYMLYLHKLKSPYRWCYLLFPTLKCKNFKHKHFKELKRRIVFSIYHFCFSFFLPNVPKFPSDIIPILMNFWRMEELPLAILEQLCWNSSLQLRMFISTSFVNIIFCGYFFLWILFSVYWVDCFFFEHLKIMFLFYFLLFSSFPGFKWEILQYLNQCSPINIILHFCLTLLSLSGSHPELWC